METPIVRETRSSVKYADRQIERAHNEAEVLEASRRSIIAKQRILAADIAKLETDRDNLAAFLAKEEAAASEAARADTVADEVYDTAEPKEAHSASSCPYTGMPAIDVRMNCIGLVINREDISQDQIVQKANELAQYVLYGPAPESILGGLTLSGRAYGSADAEFPC